MGVLGCPPPSLPDIRGAGVAARKRELQKALDRKVAILKDVFGTCSGLLMEMEGVALWEGLAAVYASRRWEVMRDLCQVLCQVRKGFSTREGGMRGEPFHVGAFSSGGL